MFAKAFVNICGKHEDAVNDLAHRGRFFEEACECDWFEKGDAAGREFSCRDGLQSLPEPPY
jgi:hypothetical protein